MRNLAFILEETVLKMQQLISLMTWQPRLVPQLLYLDIFSNVEPRRGQNVGGDQTSR